jgi:hypothetical protein
LLNIVITDLRLSLLLIINSDSILLLLHSVDVGDVAYVSEVYAASIFRFEVCRLASFCLYIALCFENQRGEREIE